MTEKLQFDTTYLYKLHLLTSSLDKAFDTVLQQWAGVTLSQFMVLLATNQHGVIAQRQIAHFLGISPPAIKRQADLLLAKKWLHTESRGVRLTPAGERIMHAGLKSLETHAFGIFSGENRQANLMEHIDRLLEDTQRVIAKQAAINEPKEII